MNIPLRHLLPEKISGYIYLLFIWLFTGFAIGTVTLLWPLRMWVNYTRENAYSALTEKVGVMALIVLLFIVSLRISLLLFQWHINQERRVITFYAAAIPMFAAAIALWLLMNPQIVNKGTEQTAVSQKFTTGPYPTIDKIVQLKKQGFTGVISLLHPAVVPFEPELLKEEEENLKKEHMELIKAPMLPWLADNTASLKLIEALAKEGKGKYYIHCYLGKDRVNVVKNLLLRVLGNENVNSNEGENSRTFETAGSFERGNIYKIDTAVYMTPFPTDEEFVSYFLAGNVKAVANLMDTVAAADSRPWIHKEQKTLTGNGLIFKNFAIKAGMPEKEINRVLDSISKLPKPLVVHQWSTSSPESKLFRKYYYQRARYTQKNLATNDLETF